MVMIQDFISDHVRRPWEPGKVDCLLALADWCVWKGHHDPASHLRGAYEDEAGFEAIIDAAGGVVLLVESCAALIGLKRAAAPVVGDIAVIGSSTDICRQFGAIWDGVSWRVRFVNDYPPVKARALAVWSV